jgi:hypothetical protein
MKEFQKFMMIFWAVVGFIILCLALHMKFEFVNKMTGEDYAFIAVCFIGYGLYVLFLVKLARAFLGKKKK